MINDSENILNVQVTSADLSAGHTTIQAVDSFIDRPNSGAYREIDSLIWKRSRLPCLHRRVDLVRNTTEHPWQKSFPRFQLLHHLTRDKMYMFFLLVPALLKMLSVKR
jgi:hypothetical protein